MRFALLPAMGLALAATLALAAGETRGYVVVVNEANSTSTIAVRELNRVFMKTVKRWDSGVAIEPVDQALESPVRTQFAKDVLGKTPSQVQEYWLRETFSGREVPPPIRPSDAAVLEYVRANKGAVGYVSGSASLPSGVKALSVTR